MELPFTHLGHEGRVLVSVATTVVPTALGARDGAIDLANCTATVEYAGRGYLQLLGWIQLVRSRDNSFAGRRFEMDPFDPFGLYEAAPSPYCWYGIVPTLFDAPSRDDRSRLDWLAHSFLAASPLRGNRRTVSPIVGFSWGFEVKEDGVVALKPTASLDAADWQSHLAYLRDSYRGWQFTEMPT